MVSGILATIATFSFANMSNKPQNKLAKGSILRQMAGMPPIQRSGGASLSNETRLRLKASLTSTSHKKPLSAIVGH